MSILPDSGRGDVFALPDRMPGKLRHVRHSCTVFGGLAGAGEVGADTLQAMANLVPCGYPALTTGNARLQYLAAPTTGAAHGLTLHRGKVVLAQGTGLFVSSGAGACTRLGNVTDTDKRFASFGDLLFILPDGLVYNAADGSLRKFGLDTGDMENVSIDNVYLTVPTAGLQTKGFRVGDCIRLDIQGDIKSAVLNGYYRISALTESYLCVEAASPSGAPLPRACAGSCPTWRDCAPWGIGCTALPGSRCMPARRGIRGTGTGRMRHRRRRRRSVCTRQAGAILPPARSGRATRSFSGRTASAV